jgi:hypothetical protein
VASCPERHGIGVAQHNLPEPCTNLGRAMMLPTLKLSLDGIEIRGHPPFRPNPPDDESGEATVLRPPQTQTLNFDFELSEKGRDG